MKTSRIVLAGVGGVLGAVIAIVIADSPNESSPTTCEELAPSIVELSQDRSDSWNQPRILKLYNIEENPSAAGDKELDCIANVRWDRDNIFSNYVWFHLEKDSDGDVFIGYKGL